jgi:hypothetical protein
MYKDFPKVLVKSARKIAPAELYLSSEFEQKDGMAHIVYTQCDQPQEIHNPRRLACFIRLFGLTTPPQQRNEIWHTNHTLKSQSKYVPILAVSPQVEFARGRVVTMNPEHHRSHRRIIMHH